MMTRLSKKFSFPPAWGKAGMGGAAALAIALGFAGCKPQADFKVSLRVIDEQTGKPIPNALVLVGAHVNVQPPLEEPYNDAIAATRGMTDENGVLKLSHVEGMYVGEKPKDWLFLMLEARKPKVNHHVTGVEGGSILVFAPGYGVMEQPFYIEGKGTAADAGGRYGYGWLGVKGAAWYKAPLALRFKDIRGGRLDLKVAKPKDLDAAYHVYEYFTLIRTMTLVSKVTGTTQQEKDMVWEFFKEQLEYAASLSDDPFFLKSLDYFVDPKLKADFDNQDTALAERQSPLYAWMTGKALEQLPGRAGEVKQFAQQIQQGVADEGLGSNPANHFYNPRFPQEAFANGVNALQWGAINYPENPNNNWDWLDAQTYYQQGDKIRAYQALGHVLRLLENLSIPRYTQQSLANDESFENYLASVADANGDLPQEFAPSQARPTFALTPKARFDAVANQTLSLTTTDPTSQEAYAKTVLPPDIQQGAGLLLDFYKLMHRAAYVQAPGNGSDGEQDDGGGQEVEASTGTETSNKPVIVPNSSAASIVPGNAGTIQTEVSTALASGNANKATMTLPSTDKQVLENDVAHLQSLLQEYNEGKRDDTDGGAIIFRLLRDYGKLGLANTKDGVALRREWNDLVLKHPQFKYQPPMHTHEEIEASQAAARQVASITEKANGEFVPKDTKYFGFYGYGRRAVLQYQYHLDFYLLPKTMILRTEGINAALHAYDAKSGEILGDIPTLGLKPIKVLTFAHQIGISSSGPQERHFIWACDDLTAPYIGSDQEERNIIRRKYPDGFYWQNPLGEFKEFCGAISLNGTIIYELPLKQHDPSTVFDLGQLMPDGTTIVISVGQKQTFPDDEDGGSIQLVKNIREALIWTYPNHLSTYSVKDATKVNKVLAGCGFHGRPWPW